ncbi:stage VI sporulation protein D [Paraliobacillus salinarum]|uniref:stage VI sporulation protein D n=1 Tax=Paraliobacillus salinarum TaxID=1158996 RepID=UPI0015F72127|nr:stage VI sporulation protein D [Paraliobacillus salinarum]
MSDQNQNVFTFELDESLRLKNGQEVGEMIHISLEPEISIETFSDHISVRGVMELRGEYYVDLDASPVYMDEALDIREYPNQRYLDTVERQEDGVNYFAHQFPIEISIPSHRVSNLDEVLVGIETFDYEIPEQSKLRLNATIAIHGIDCEERSEEQEEVSELEEVTAELDEETSESDTFRFEVEEPEIKESDEESEESIELNETKEMESSNESSEDTTDNADDEKTGRWPTNKSQSFADFFGKKTELDESSESSDEIESIESVESIESIESIEVNEVPSEESSETQRTEDETSIANFFNHEEEQSYTKLRMCIVQESDTLATIAERYKVPTIQLLQTNALENDDLSAGQILYIPNKRKKK